ncbi:noncanonical pyrimidine nucleotidase, YjjG family [Nonlabens sp. MB-3u-79]|uniref:YjjG family noncanonical pyrimidine nucleotidase n=1 Tax=Nonlabens sp. MB-3u-79 TaxID=2058134 RepID=UPI000C302B17|nr:YjjG family noncanonical pyrimidine nucleotidase [Nonlabens sp. MB-3u-79]AUC79192.1 noncanonical pyrimidine nucleotidase, YjjG family [Nonlabens sp. MB-3u-79]|tara:strand:+ start:122 stop:820 length:699 start_codon:yes stop_codon:yes gene_type:complete
MTKKFNNIEHIFFDLDHTLWDFDLNSKLAYKQIFEEHQLTLELDRFIEIYEPLNLQFWRMFRENKISKENLRFQRLKTAFDACDYAVEDEKIHLFADLYMEYLPNYNHLFDGCIELLDQLQDNYRLHLITNGFNGVQQNKIKNSGLDKYFDVVLTAEAAGVKKPAPEIFHKALQMANAEVANSLMIGDSYEADIKGAQNIGLATIWFQLKDEVVPEHEVVVRHLRDIYPLLS